MWITPRLWRSTRVEKVGSALMTWRVMSGNGYSIGTMNNTTSKKLKMIPKDRQPGQNGLFAVARGIFTAKMLERRIDSKRNLPIPKIILDFELSQIVRALLYQNGGSGDMI